MRVAVLTESFHPVINGVSVSVDTLAKELVKLGHEPHVFAPRYRDHQDHRSYPVHRLSSGPAPGAPDYRFAYPVSPGFSRALRALQPDVIHTQSPFLLGWAGVYWSRRLGVPLVTTLHTIYEEYVHYARWVPGALARQVVIGLTRWHSDRAHAVIVPTEPIQHLLRGYGVRGRIEVVPTGIPLERFEEADPAGIREAHGISPRAPLVLYAGRLAKEKNLEVLLDAFGRVHRAYPESRLLLVGGGPMLEATQALARRMALEHAVVFAGFRSPEETRRYYRAADLFLYPSVTDTQGLVLCEALAAGLPCVAADRFGAKAVVRHEVDGLLVPPEADALADAVLSLVADPARHARMRREALSGADRFATHHAVQRLLEVYRSVLGDSPARTPPLEPAR